MIRHVGIAERIEVQEPERRKQTAGENQSGCEKSAPPATREPDAYDEDQSRGAGKADLPAQRRIDCPPWVVERQVCRPDELACVEEKSARRKHGALPGSKREIGARRADPVPL